MRPDPRLFRLGLSTAVAATVISVGLASTGSTSGAAPGNPVAALHGTTSTLVAIHASEDHDENDLAVKNALSRSPEAASTVDPTTDSERAAAEEYVASERAMADPTLITGNPHAASRRSRRCAATSTRTPTAWPSSSSAATRTAASRGTVRRAVRAGRLPRPHRDRRQRRRSWRTSCPASRSHDPVGWPTFKDWPAPHSLTHEGTY
jgi:hypothetical protein